MKVLLVGAGTIGNAIIAELGQQHEIITVGKTSGQHQVDLTNIQSIENLFKKVGKVDAIIAAAGNVHWGSFKEMTSDEFKIGINEKLMGQVNLSLIGQKFLNEGGSITLTSGSLSHDPHRGGASFTTVNSAVDGFIRGVSVELEGGRRINSVSPNVLVESWHLYGAGVPGTTPVPAALVAKAYRKSVEGHQTGQTYQVW